MEKGKLKIINEKQVVNYKNCDLKKEWNEKKIRIELTKWTNSEIRQ